MAPREDSFLYTARQVKKIRKTIAKGPFQNPQGSTLCPFCLHIEARWRGQPSADESGDIKVRVLCSQCQRRATYLLKG
jgi:hypothetical protein